MLPDLTKLTVHHMQCCVTKYFAFILLFTHTTFAILHVQQQPSKMMIIHTTSCLTSGNFYM